MSLRRAVMFAAAAVLAEIGWGANASWPTSEHGERGKWRISVGVSVIGPVRSKVGVNHAQVRQLSGFCTPIARHAAEVSGGRTKTEAFAAGSGEADPNGVMRFDGGAWYDPHDSASANDPDWSWNWRLHDPTGPDPAGRKGFTERTEYSEVSEAVVISDSGEGAGWSSDGEKQLPGLRVELAYELYRSNRENDGCVERNTQAWGVDIALAFAYYFQRELWKAGGEAATASVNGRQEDGYYEWWNDSYDTAQYGIDYDRDSQFHDGMWGAGTFVGPGFELATPEWYHRDVSTGSSSWSSSHSLGYRGRGDYREYSIELLVRPWWEPWEWLRVFGSVGAELSRRRFEWSLDAWGTEGSVYHEHGIAKDWQPYGLIGGGLSIFWRDFTLAGEALWRFGGDDLDVYGRTVRGKIKRGLWGFRLSLGYEF